jgi:hypothetical protein
MLVCYVVYMSWTNSQSEVIAYPWESLLCETSALALLLHPTSPPSPYVAWLFRWLLFRLMFGFGKKKFAWGSEWYKHTMYIREFFVNNPSPTPSALFFHQNLPPWGFPHFLYGMFVTEIIIPFFFFLGQPYCGIAGIATIGLMGGIQLGGNFGHFNILTSVLCIPLLDGLLSPAQSTDAIPASSVTILIFGLSSLSGLLHLPFDSFTDRPMFQLFCVMGWVKKETSDAVQPFSSSLPTRAAVMFLSCIKALKISNAYGVFHTESRAPVRQVVVFEGSVDGKTWHEYQHFQSAPHFKFIAPLQPFLGYAMFYYGAGFPSCVHLYPLSQILPFSQTRITQLHRVCERLLHPSSNSTVVQLFSVDPFPGKCPSKCRVRLVARTFGSIDGGDKVKLNGRHIMTLVEETGPNPRVWKKWHQNLSLECAAYSWFGEGAKRKTLRAALNMNEEDLEMFWGWLQNTVAASTIDSVEEGAKGKIKSCGVGPNPAVPTKGWAGVPTAVAKMRADMSEEQIDMLETILKHITVVNESSFQQALPELTSFDLEYMIHYTLLQSASSLSPLSSALASADKDKPACGRGEWISGNVPQWLMKAASDQLHAEMAADADCPRSGGVKVAMILRTCFWFESVKISSSFQRLSQLRDGRSQYKVVPLIWKLMNAKADGPTPGGIFFKCVNALETTVEDWKVELHMDRIAMDETTNQWHIVDAVDADTKKKR